MINVPRNRSAFTTSSGIVASDRLKMQIEENSTITTTLETIVSQVSVIDFWFETALTGAEETALDTIVTNHSGLGIPTGSFDTQHSIINAASVAATVPSFVDETHVLLAAIGIKNQRQALGPGLLQRVRLRSSLASAAATVQLVIGGVAVGVGITQALAPNVGIDFDLLLAENEYAKDNLLSVSISGLALTSDTTVEALWSEGSPAP